MYVEFSGAVTIVIHFGENNAEISVNPYSNKRVDYWDIRKETQFRLLNCIFGACLNGREINLRSIIASNMLVTNYYYSTYVFRGI